MLFDIEDYREMGFIDIDRRWSSQSTFVNKIGRYVGGSGYSDPQVTGKATKDAYRNAIVSFFGAAMPNVPFEKKQAAVDQFIVWMEKFRNVSISEKQYWNMLLSMPVVSVSGGKVFQAGEEFFVEHGQISDPVNQAKYIGHTNGYKGNEWMAADGISEETLELWKTGYLYSQHAVFTDSPNKNPINGNMSITYTPFDQTVADNYYQKFEELMTATKDLMVKLEGYATNYEPVVE